MGLAGGAEPWRGRRQTAGTGAGSGAQGPLRHALLVRADHCRHGRAYGGIRHEAGDDHRSTACRH